MCRLALSKTIIVVACFAAVSFFAFFGGVEKAEAGVYQVQSCSNADHTGSTVFQPFSNNSGFAQNWGSGCTAIGMAQSWVATSDAPQGATAGFYLEAPAGTSFSYLYWQQMLISQGGGTRCVYATDGAGTGIGADTSNCFTNTKTAQNSGWVTREGSLNSSRINLNLICFYGSCNNVYVDPKTGGATKVGNQIVGGFGYANANITDNTSPGITDLGGVWGRGWVRGQWPLSWNGNDSLGVKQHVFNVDGSRAGTGSQFCSPASLSETFYYGSVMQPCPNPGQAGYQSASFNVNTAAYSDGSHSLSAISYDTTSNAGQATTTLYADNSKPSNVVFNSGPADGAWTNDSSPTFGFSSTDPQSGIGGYKCQIDGGGAYGCASPATLPAQSEGQHQLCVKSYNNALDSNGVAAESPFSCTTFKVDTAPPSAFLGIPPAFIAAQGTILNGQASDPVAGIKEVIFQARPESGGAWQQLCLYSNASPYACSVNGSALTNDTVYELRLLATNNAGSSTASLIQTSRVDNQPPSAPVIASGPADNSWINVAQASYAFSSTDPISGIADYQCSQVSPISWSACISPTLFSSLISGWNTVSFRAKDNAGNISAPATRTVGSDMIDPVLALVNLPDDISGIVNVSGEVTDTLSGVDSVSVAIKIRSLPSGAFSDICPTPSQTGNNYSCSLDTNPLADGSYQMQISGTDNVGNFPPSWPTNNVVVDNTGPVIVLDTANRSNYWTVTDAVGGVDPTGFNAHFRVGEEGAWQEMDDAYWNSETNRYHAAVPDSIVGNTVIQVRLKATSNSQITTTNTSPEFALPLQVPVNEIPPAVTGLDRDGEILTTTSGDWSGLPTITFTYLWLRCSTSGDDCVWRPAASSTTTTLVDADAGQRIRSLVHASNPDGTNAEDSQATAIIEAMPPSSSSPPVLSGTARQGQQLSVADGLWDGTTPLAFSYQWQRCDNAGNNCSNIVGQTDNNYTLTNQDVARIIQAKVTADNSSLPGGGSANANSNQSIIVDALVPSGNGLPEISGQDYTTATITTNNGQWFGSQPLVYDYQWLRCDNDGNNCSGISGEEGNSLLLTPSDLGLKIRVRVTADNSALPGGSSAQQTSQPTTVILNGRPTNLTQPTISGTAKEGQQLAVTNGTWSGITPITYFYQWQRCNPSCSDIQGATTAAYLAEYADVGYTLRAAVTANNSSGQDAVYSTESGPVQETPDPPVSTSPPVISGSPDEGQQLTVTDGSWSGRSPINYAYQWQRCNPSCSNIPSATNQNYQAQASDVDYMLRAIVTATNIDGSEHADSSPVGPVDPLIPENHIKPSISGSPYVAAQLTANHGQWSGQGTISFSYQWLSCQQDGGDCQNVSSSVNYQASASDIGRDLKVEVTASNVYGSQITSSSLYGPIAKQPVNPVNIKPPTVSGNATVGQLLTTNNGQWESDTEIVYSYQWQLCSTTDLSSCQNIFSDNKTNYLLTSNDYNKYLRSAVLATSRAGTSRQVSSVSSKIKAPACLNSATIKSASIKLMGRTARFSGAKQGYYGGKRTVTLSARANRPGLTLSWSLSGKTILKTKRTKSVLKLSNQRLLLGKQALVLTVSKGRYQKSIKRTVTTKACPPSKQLTPKPTTKIIKLSGKTNKASIAENYSALQYGKWSLSGAAPSSLTWKLDNKKMSSKRTFLLSPTKLSIGKHQVSLTVRRGKKSKTATWSVIAK